MTKPTAPDEAPELLDPATADDLAYEAPQELEEAAGRRPRSIALKLAAVAALGLVVGGALLGYRAHHRKKVIEAALTQADALLRRDTAAGYQQAASLLEPIAQLDPIVGASVRAFALAMLFADYRQSSAEAEIENLLVRPGRAEDVPPHAQLAAAALALGRREAGTATTAVSRGGAGPWPLALQARVALLAGNVEAALQPAAAAAAEGAFPPGLALHADVLRRLRRDPAAARAAYEAALAASPAQPRAAYGLAKLALSGLAPAAEAEEALRRIADDLEGTPAVERGRASSAPRGAPAPRRRPDRRRRDARRARRSTPPRGGGPSAPRSWPPSIAVRTARCRAHRLRCRARATTTRASSRRSRLLPRPRPHRRRRRPSRRPRPPRRCRRRRARRRRRRAQEGREEGGREEAPGEEAGAEEAGAAAVAARNPGSSCSPAEHARRALARARAPICTRRRHALPRARAARARRSTDPGRDRSGTRAAQASPRTPRETRDGRQPREDP